MILYHGYYADGTSKRDQYLSCSNEWAFEPRLTFLVVQPLRLLVLVHYGMTLRLVLIEPAFAYSGYPTLVCRPPSVCPSNGRYCNQSGMSSHGLIDESGDISFEPMVQDYPKDRLHSKSPRIPFQSSGILPWHELQPTSWVLCKSPSCCSGLYSRSSTNTIHFWIHQGRLCH